MADRTPSQTAGPYLHIGLAWCARTRLAGDAATGRRIEIAGRLIDGAGLPVPDGLVEIWQANAHGRYRHDEDSRDLPLDADFEGFGRCATDADGAFRFHTLLPGRVPGPDGRLQAPHVLVSVFARGILRRMATRIYFAGEAANADDYILGLVPAGRRDTLLAQPVDGSSASYRFDIVLQGEWQGRGETVFFDID